MTSLNFLVPQRDFRFLPADAHWDFLDLDRAQKFLVNFEAIMDEADSLALYMNEDKPLHASQVEAELRACLGDQDPQVIENRNADPQSRVPLTWTRVLSGICRQDFRQVNDVYHLNVDGMVVEVPLMAYKMLGILQLGIGKQPAKEDVQQEKNTICILSQKMDVMIQGLTNAVDRMNRLQEKLQDRQEAIDIGLNEAGRSYTLNRTQETSHIDQGPDRHQGGNGIEDTRDDEYITVEGSVDSDDSSSSSDTASETSSVHQKIHGLQSNVNTTSTSSVTRMDKMTDSEDDKSVGESQASTPDEVPISEQISHSVPKELAGSEYPRPDQTGGNSMQQGSMLEADMDFDMMDEPVGRADSDEGHSIIMMGAATTQDGNATQPANNNIAAGASLTQPPGGTSGDIQLPTRARRLSDIPLASNENNISPADDEKRHGFYFIQSLKKRRVKWDDIVVQYAFRFGVHRRTKNLQYYWMRWCNEGKRLLILEYTPGTQFPRPSTISPPTNATTTSSIFFASHESTKNATSPNARSLLPRARETAPTGSSLRSSALAISL